MVSNLISRVKIGDIFSLTTKNISPALFKGEMFLHFSIPAYDENKQPSYEQGGEIKSNKYLLNRDSLLVSKLNPRINRVWKAAIHPNQPRSICSTEFMVYQTDRCDVNLEYYYHLFSSEMFQEILLSLQSGTTGSRMRVTPKDTLNLTVPFPKLADQRKIASILTSVDNVIAATQRIIDQTEVVKRGLMQQLLTKGIGHTTFKKTEIGEIPTEWGIARLRDVAKIIDCKHYTPEYTEIGVPIIRTNDLTTGDLVLEGTNYTSDDDYKVLTDKYTPKKGDIVYGREGSFGVACYVDTDEKFSIGQRVVVISPYNIQSRYLHLALNSPIVLEQVQLASLGTTVKRINVKDINDLWIPVPPSDEQKRIADTILPLAKKLEMESRTLMALNQVKTSLMQVLLTGKVRVNVNEPSEVSV